MLKYKAIFQTLCSYVIFLIHTAARRNKGWVCNDPEEAVNNGGLTIVVTSAMLLTEPRVPPDISVLIRFLWSNDFFFFFARRQCLLFKIICPLVRDHVWSFFCPYNYLGKSWTYCPFYRWGNWGSEWPSIAQGHAESDPCLSVSIAVPYSVSKVCHPRSLSSLQPSFWAN